MIDFDDLSAALRRDLTSVAVSHDDDRAEAMIRAATVADPLGPRNWQAPLAAAAAIVVVGGGAAALAATHGGGRSAAGGATTDGNCPAVAVSSTPASVESATPSPASTAPSAPSDDASCTAALNPPAIYPLPPASTAPVGTALVSTPPASTAAPLPIAGVGTPSTAPTPPAATSSAGTSRIALEARPGRTVTEAVGGLPVVASAHLVSNAGTAGTIAVYRGSDPTVMHDTVGAFVEETITPEQPVRFGPSEPLTVRLTCAGSVTCRVEVTLSGRNQR